MLVLTRKAGETIAIGDDILLTVVEVGPGRVKLGIVAPRHVDVDRLEVRTRREGGPRRGEFETPASIPLHNRITGQLPAEPSSITQTPSTHVNRLRKVRMKPR